MPLVALDDADDPRIDDYRQVRDADLLGRRGAFLAEGEVVLRVLLARGRFAVRSLLLAEPRAARLLASLPPIDPAIPVYTLPQRAMDALVGFPIHRGILAAGAVGEPLGVDALLSAPGPRLAVALEGVVNHDNVGGIFRNCGAFGVGAVLLDEVCCDPLYRKAIRVSAGASLFVPFARSGGRGAALEALRRRGYRVLALTPDAAAVPLASLPALPDRVALLLGAEGPGLSAESMAEADLRVRVEMAPGFDSLNVATTSGIALHRIFSGRPGLGAPLSG